MSVLNSANSVRWGAAVVDKIMAGANAVWSNVALLGHIIYQSQSGNPSIIRSGEWWGDYIDPVKDYVEIPHNVYDAAINPSGNRMAVLHQHSDTTTAPILAYPYSDGFFGTALSRSVVSNSTWGGMYNINFHPQGNAVMFSIRFAPYMAAFAFSDNVGTMFAQYPSTVSGGIAYEAKWNHEGTVAHRTTGAGLYTYAFAWTGSGFGSKFADPATPLGGRSYGHAWANDDSEIYYSIANVAETYAWTGSGYGTRMSAVGLVDRYPTVDPASGYVDYSYTDQPVWSNTGSTIFRVGPDSSITASTLTNGVFGPTIISPTQTQVQPYWGEAVLILDYVPA